ncbi:MAG: DinB family protein [Acidobacteria bacterium]|nr:DinB family protein [Acidobacteriota bacterium]
MDTFDALIQELQAAAAGAARLAAAPSSAFTRRPHPQKWSAAECFEHLNLTTKAYLPKLEAAFSELQQSGLRSPGPFRMDWQARLLHWLLAPPARLRMPTSPPFFPAASEDTIPQFSELQQRLISLLEQHRGLALDRARISSPFAERVRYNLYSAFRLIAVHQRRHLWQAGRALQP